MASEQKSAKGGCMLLITLVLFGVFIKWFGSDPEPPEPYSVKAAREEAARDPFAGQESRVCDIAHETIGKLLIAPASAEWPSCWSADGVTYARNGVYHVKSYVDSQNAFGAKLRRHYSLDIRLTTDKTVIGNVSALEILN
jgi:hypothetical protein